MAKSKKIEKETRKLMESIGDLVKKKSDRYKFKTKSKKQIKRVKRTCPHWIYRKGKECPTVIRDPEHPNMWRCTICGALFPVAPMTLEEYQAQAEAMIASVNQMQFWGVKLGGDAEDTKMFLRLREYLPRFEKVTKHILKAVNRRQAWEENRERGDMMSQFDAFSGFGFK